MTTLIDSKKKDIEIKGRIREFVFGIQDALISTVGLLTGVEHATSNSRMVVITGLAAAFTGALSMATGSYLSSKAQKEIFDKELKDQEKLITGEPYVAQEGLLNALKEEGLSRENAYRVVNVLAREKSVFLRTFQEKVLGLGSADISNPLQGAIVMYLSFVIGASIPIAPYFFLTSLNARTLSVVGTSLSLFLVAARPFFCKQKPQS